MADPAAVAQFSQLASVLKQAGLDDLFTLDSQGNPGGWLWNQIQSGIDTEIELEMAIEQTDTFRDRFGVILEQRKRAAEGGSGTIMTPAQVLQYEQTVKEYLSAAGLPATFYDDPKDFHEMILSDMSPTEVKTRVTQAFDYVLSAPPEVRQAFEDYYGVGNGDAQLAAWALDPERTTADINRSVRTAYAGGMAERYDIQIDKSTATRIADSPMGQSGIDEGMQRVAAMEDVFNEGLGDSGTDLTDETGVQSVFDSDAQATGAISRRVMRRRAVGRSASGGAAITQEGVVGVGSS